MFHSIKHVRLCSDGETKNPSGISKAKVKEQKQKRRHWDKSQPLLSRSLIWMNGNTDVGRRFFGRALLKRIGIVHIETFEKFYQEIQK